MVFSSHAVLSARPAAIWFPEERNDRNNVSIAIIKAGHFSVQKTDECSVEKKKSRKKPTQQPRIYTEINYTYIHICREQKKKVIFKRVLHFYPPPPAFPD